jgi:hypothetical protein
MVYDHVWIEMSQDTKLPLWQRVTYRAMGSMNRLNHAPFHEGELADLLGVKHRQHITRAIDTAKKKGWISPDSWAHCIQIPEHRAYRGVGAKECRVCGVRWLGR